MNNGTGSSAGTEKPLTLLIVVLSFVILMTVILMAIYKMTRDKRLYPEENMDPDKIRITMSPFPMPPDDTAFFLPSVSSVLRPNALPPDYGMLLYHALSALRQNDAPEAEDLLRTLHLYYPDSLTVIRLLANLLYSRGAYAAAERQFQKMREVLPGDAVVLNNIAMSQAKQGKLQEALRNLQEVLKTAPELTTTELNMAGIYAKAGNRAEAVNCLRKAYSRIGTGILAVRDNPDFQSILSAPEVRDLLSAAQEKQNQRRNVPERGRP